QIDHGFAAQLAAISECSRRFSRDNVDHAADPHARAPHLLEPPHRADDAAPGLPDAPRSVVVEIVASWALLEHGVTRYRPAKGGVRARRHKLAGVQVERDLQLFERGVVQNSQIVAAHGLPCLSSLGDRILSRTGPEGKRSAPETPPPSPLPASREGECLVGSLPLLKNATRLYGEISHLSSSVVSTSIWRLTTS